MKNQAGTSRLDTVLKMLLIAFISLLAFSSGVYFGKEMSDSDYKLKALETDFKDQSQKTAGEEKNMDQKPKDALNDEDVAAISEKAIGNEKDKLKDEPVENAEGRGVASEEVAHEGHEAAHEEQGKKDAHHAEAEHHAAPAEHHAAPAEHGAHHEEAAHHEAHGEAAAHHDEAAHHETKKPDLTQVHKVAERVANNAVPVESHKPVSEPRGPQSLPKTVGASADFEFTVQVASYPSQEEAKKHVEELVNKGFPAYPVEAAVNGKNWYRVSVGTFKTQKEAASYRAQLMKQAEVKSAIVQKIQR